MFLTKFIVDRMFLLFQCECSTFFFVDEIFKTEKLKNLLIRAAKPPFKILKLENQKFAIYLIFLLIFKFLKIGKIA